MYIVDIIVFIVVIITIIGLLLYFKRDNILEDIKGIFITKEDFLGGAFSSALDFGRDTVAPLDYAISLPGAARNSLGSLTGSTNIEKYNLTDLNVNIGKNLFIGFNDSVDSDKQQELLKNAAMGKFQTNLKSTDLSKGNIFINGGTSKNIGNICLGGGVGNICMDKLNLNNFDDTKYPIPVFKKGNKQVYYNNDQKLVNHNKLCFKDTGGTDKCIDKKHLNMINGSHALRLNMKKDDGSTFESIQPYNVEFGKRKGFSNVISHPFYMLSSDYTKAKPIIENSTKTCYGSGGRQYHTVSNSSSMGDQYYLKTEPQPNALYSHIHKHSDS